jgi:hypothetical protein
VNRDSSTKNVKIQLLKLSQKEKMNKGNKILCIAFFVPHSHIGELDPSPVNPLQLVVIARTHKIKFM